MSEKTFKLDFSNTDVFTEAAAVVTRDLRDRSVKQDTVRISDSEKAHVSRMLLRLADLYRSAAQDVMELQWEVKNLGTGDILDAD